MRAEVQYLEDMIDSARQIADIDLQAFREDRRTRSAVLHELTVIGESANKLSVELKSKHADVPWDQIVGTRNIIVHGYFDLLWDRIWRTITVDVPVLEGRAEEILARELHDMES